MTMRGGRRLLANTRPPVGTGVGATPYVDDDGFIAWLAQPSGGFAPTFIASGQTFEVPDNKQVLYAVTIDNEGTINIGDNAYLVMVD